MSINYYCLSFPRVDHVIEQIEGWIAISVQFKISEVVHHLSLDQLPHSGNDLSLLSLQRCSHYVTEFIMPEIIKLII